MVGMSAGAPRSMLDYEGAELADQHEAFAHVVRAARSLASDSVLQGHFTTHHFVEIMDASHGAIGKVRFDEAVDIRS